MGPEEGTPADSPVILSYCVVGQQQRTCVREPTVVFTFLFYSL